MNRNVQSLHQLSAKNENRAGSLDKQKSLKSLEDQIGRLETQNKQMDQIANDAKAYASKKEQKRKKQIGQLERDLQETRHYHENPDEFNQDVKNEISNALLRIAENQILDEMKLEGIEKRIKEKEKEIGEVQEQIGNEEKEGQELEKQIEDLKARIAQVSSHGIPPQQSANILQNNLGVPTAISSGAIAQPSQSTFGREGAGSIPVSGNYFDNN